MNEVKSASPSFRLFIALPVPAMVKEELRRLQAELREHLPGQSVRWTRPEQIHLTLKFLGKVSGDRVAELEQAVRRACAGFAPISLRAERIGFFPQIHLPRVIWAWVHDDWGALPRLHQALEEATAGFTAERREETFTGHLTIARTHDIKPAQARALGDLAMGMTNRVFGDWRAISVSIMGSELSPDGSRHSTLAEIPLTGEGRR